MVSWFLGVMKGDLVVIYPNLRVNDRGQLSFDVKR
jgi:hypothetical protein